MIADTIQKPKKNRVGRWIVAIIIILIFLWAFTGIRFGGIRPSAWPITQAILGGVVNPDWDYVYRPEGEDLLRGLLETISIAYLGTFIAAFLTIPFGFLAAKNISRLAPITAVGKFILSFIRAFPELIFALIFIKAVGPGTFAGVLALGLNSIGMLGKLSSEALENMDLGPTEALVACGANRLKTLWFGVVPQILPEYLNYVLYRFELNVRAAAILGVIGAGGIGTPLIFALMGRSWDRVGIIFIGIVIMVILIDGLSGRIRRHLV